MRIDRINLVEDASEEKEVQAMLLELERLSQVIELYSGDDTDDDLEYTFTLDDLLVASAPEVSSADLEAARRKAESDSAAASASAATVVENGNGSATAAAPGEATTAPAQKTHDEVMSKAQERSDSFLYVPRFDAEEDDDDEDLDEGYEWDGYFPDPYVVECEPHALEYSAA